MGKETMLDLVRYMEEQGISEEDPRRNQLFQKAMNLQFRACGKPELGVLELTPLCNLDCKMCYVHLNARQLGARQVCAGEEWLRWIDEAIELGMLNVELTGGEAMMHPEFDEIYLYLWKKGIRTTVMTNGILLNSKRIAFFRKYPPASIQVTFYGGSQECYELVTGHRMFETVKRNVLAAKTIGCRMVISITPSRYFGREDALRVQAFARENDIHLIVNNDLNEPRGDTGRTLSQFNLSMEEYLDIHKALYPLAGEPAPLSDLPGAGDSQEECRGILCSAGKAMFCVTWDGQMKACFDLPESYSLKQGTFREGWERLHETACRYLIPSECKNCPYQKVCNRCPAVHMQNAPKGHADRRICERTRRMVAEGLVDKRALVDQKAM